MQTIQFNAGPHRPDTWVSKETVPVSRMLLSEAFWYQNLNLLPQQFLPRVAEYVFHLCIDQNDFALLTYYHHGIWSCFQQSSKFRLGSLSLTNVTDGA